MFKSLNDRAFLVGGPVRDLLMGKEPKDMDYVIERCSIEEFRSVFPDAQQIGTKPNSPPVYSVDGNDVALARIEEQVGSGKDYTDSYQFESGVTILQDLQRRDFTMNSIAKHVVTGEILDPFNGIQDIKDGVLRCVNPSAFSEDPLRILRWARFYARYGFCTDPDTMIQMMNHAEDLVDVLPERIHIELTKVYKESDKPSRFFRSLHLIGALKYHFKPLYLLTKVPAGPVLYHGKDTGFDHVLHSFDYAKQHGYSDDVAFAALFHDTGKGVTRKEILPNHRGHELRSFLINQQYVKQHRFTSKQQEMMICFGKNHMKFHFIEQMTETKLVRFYRAIKKYFEEFIQCANCDTPLNPKQIEILRQIEYAVKHTEIVIPNKCADPGAYVEEQCAKTLRRLRGGK